VKGIRGVITFSAKKVGDQLALAAANTTTSLNT